MNLPRSSPEGLGSLPGKTHYYAGSDPSMWLTVPQYARVRYRAVFPGVDLVVYGKQHQLEYDWVVAPGADPASIRFAFSGASTMRVDEHGDLVLAAAGGEIRHRRPKIYQMQNGQRLEVDGGFILARNGEVRFRVGEYDRRGTLIIDPELVFSTGFGGSPIRVNFPGTHSIVSDTGTGIALDGGGNIYVVGTAFSTDFPLIHSAQPVPPSDCCLLRYLFAAKLSSDGKTLLYSTYVAAPQNPQSLVLPPVPAAFAVDADGNAYITALLRESISRN